MSPIPEGRTHISPYLVVEEPQKLLEFVREVFGAVELRRVTRPDGAILNAQVRIGETVVMVSQAREGVPYTPSWLWLYLADTDAAYRRALEAGAASVMEPTDEFYGDRTAGVRDPAGIVWWLNTRREELSSEEIQRRFDGLSKPRAPLTELSREPS